MLYQICDCAEEVLQSSFRASECDDGDSDEGDWEEDLGLDSPTDFDEHEMNADDSFEDFREEPDYEYA